MKRTLALLVAVFAAVAFVHPDDADARRMGGGRSFGAQRSITPAPRTTPPAVAPVAPTRPGAAENPVMPAQPGTATARPATPPAAAPAGGFSRWLGPIAGIAAGLGLAALFSHLGLSAGFGSLLLLIVLVGVGFVVLRALFARGVARGPAAYPATPPRAPETSARVEPTMSRIEPMFAGASSGSAAGRFPPGFDAPAFAAEAKRQFQRLQQAYDRGDRSLLADVLTPQMQGEIGRELDERTSHVPTEIVSLDADVLDVATEGREHWASVRFKGVSREDGHAPEPFDEVWNLVKPVDGSVGWRLAGIQQYA